PQRDRPGLPSRVDRPAPGGGFDGGRRRRPGNDAGGVPRPGRAAAAALRDPSRLAGAQPARIAGAVADDDAGDLPRAAGGGEQRRAPFRVGRGRGGLVAVAVAGPWRAPGGPRPWQWRGGDASWPPWHGQHATPRRRVGCDPGGRERRRRDARDPRPAAERGQSWMSLREIASNTASPRLLTSNLRYMLLIRFCTDLRELQMPSVI